MDVNNSCLKTTRQEMRRNVLRRIKRGESNPKVSRFLAFLKLLRISLYIIVLLMGVYMVSQLIPDTLEKAKILRPIAVTHPVLLETVKAVVGKGREVVYSPSKTGLENAGMIIANTGSMPSSSDQTVIYLSSLNEKINNNDFIYASPKSMIRLSESLALTLSQQEPSLAKFYQYNADGYIQKLLLLDKELTALHTCINRKKLHFSQEWDYIVKDYEFMTSPQGKNVTLIPLQENYVVTMEENIQRIKNECKE